MVANRGKGNLGTKRKLHKNLLRTAQKIIFVYYEKDEKVIATEIKLRQKRGRGWCLTTSIIYACYSE